MSQFLACIYGSRTQSSRLGTLASGIRTTTKSWAGEVNVIMNNRRIADGSRVDWVRVVLEPHGGDAQQRIVLYDGPCSGWQDYHARGPLGRATWRVEHANQGRQAV